MVSYGFESIFITDLAGIKADVANHPFDENEVEMCLDQALVMRFLYDVCIAFNLSFDIENAAAFGEVFVYEITFIKAVVFITGKNQFVVFALFEYAVDGLGVTKQ